MIANQAAIIDNLQQQTTTYKPLSIDKLNRTNVDAANDWVSLIKVLMHRLICDVVDK